MYEKNGKNYIVKLNDFADENAVSIRTVQKKLTAERYKKKLEGEFIRTASDGTWLTQEAADFLKATLRTRAVAGVITSEKYEREIEDLRQQLFETQQKFTDYVANTTPLLQKASDQIALAERAGEYKEKSDALEAQNADLKADNQKKDEILEETKKTAENVKIELTEAQKQIQELKNASLMKRLFRWK